MSWEKIVVIYDRMCIQGSDTMPELPEVEVVRRSLKKIILNKEIVNVELLHKNILNDNYEEFKKALIGYQFEDVLRFGKYLVFVLNNDYVLISHLRMEGKYRVVGNEPYSKHEHLIYTFKNGETLRYDDTRKFGRIDLRLKSNYLKTKPLNQLGAEPNDLDIDVFYNKLQKTKRPIKVSLLDQTIIAGLGNIYVDEVLFLSKILPTRISNEVTYDEAKAIKRNAIMTLEKATKLGGTTIHTFSATDIDGLFQNELLVHTKKGHPCIVCGNLIIKTKVSGRGTYICEHCQK